MSLRVTTLLLTVCAALSACAAQPQTVAQTSRPSASSQIVTGSLIPRPVNAAGQVQPDPMLKTYGSQQLKGTGVTDDLGASLFELDPAIRMVR